MRVEPFFDSQVMTMPHGSQLLDSHFSSSSLTQMRETSRKRSGSILKNLSEMIASFFRWIGSFFFTVAPLKKFEYEKKGGEEGKKIVYRLIYKGERTENVVKITPRYASLEALMLLDAHMENGVGDMVREIMDKEKIDFLLVSNLDLAHKLWKMGLETHSTIPFSPQKQTPWDDFILKAIGTARKGIGLSGGQRMALEHIDEELVKGIISQMLPHIDKAVEYIRAIEKAMGREFDLEQMAKAVQGKREEILQSSLLKIIEKKDDQGRQSGVFDSISLDIPLSSFFAVLEYTKEPLRQEFRTKVIRNVQFSNGSNYEN